MNLTDEQAKKIIELAGIVDVDYDNITERDLSRALIIIERKLNFFQPPVEISNHHDFNILIVDDLELSIYQFNQMLTKIGVKPSVARNRDEALAELAKKDFKYYILDLFIPKSEDGLQIIEQAIAKRDAANNGTKIVVMSSTEDKSLIDKCYKMGIDKFVSKNNDWHGQILKYISDTVEKPDDDGTFTKYKINNNIEMYTILRCNSEKRINELIKDITTSVYSGCKNIILNMEKVKFFDAENANLFTEIYGLCSSNGGKLILLNVSKDIDKILEDSFLADIIPTVGSVDDALLILNQFE